MLVLTVHAGVVSGVFGEEPFIAREWRASAGLPDDRATAVVQDRDGYLWMATFGGAARFDGVRFVPMTAPKLPSEGRVPVRALCATRDGNVWGALDHGYLVCWHHDGASTVFSPQDGLPDSIPTSVCEDRDGTIYAGFTKGGVARVDRGHLSMVNDPDNLLNAPYLITDRDGTVWASVSQKVVAFRNGTLQPSSEIAGCHRIAPARDGGIWAGSYRGIHRVHPDGSVELVASIPTSTGRVSALHEDEQGALWIGTMSSSQSGILRLIDGTMVPVGPSDRPISMITNDHEGNIWAATLSDGCEMFQRQLTRVIERESRTGHAELESLTVDRSGSLWLLGDDRSLFRDEHGTWMPVKLSSAAKDEKVMCVAAAPDGGVYIGTQINGLFRWRDGQIEKVDCPKTFRYVVALFVSASGDVWAAAKNWQLIRLRGTEQTRWVLPKSVVPRCITETSTHEILLAGSDGELFRLGSEGFSEISVPGTRDAGAVRTLVCGEGDCLWLGFAGGGLGRWKDGHFSRATAADGLPDDFVSQLLADEFGRLWIGSNRGISRLDPADFEAFATGRTKRLRVVSFGLGDENLNGQANRGAQPNCLRASNGELWFTTGNRVVVVKPQARPPNLRPPPVIFEELQVDDRVVALPAKPGADLQIPPGPSKIEFAYTALSFSSPENVHFCYQLKGVDKSWVEAGTNRHAVYSSLTPGAYRFHVIACNNDGLWNEVGAGLSFVVLPHYWQTFWFRACLIGTAMGLGILITRQIAHGRLRRHLATLEKEQALAQERVRIARDMHDELGSCLGQLVLVGESAKGDQASLAAKDQHLAEMTDTARDVVKRLNELVWAVNPKNDSLPKLASYLEHQAVTFLQLAGVQCHLVFPDNLPPHPVAAAIRHNLSLAVREALHNVTKHASATSATFRLEYANSVLQIELEDNGRGFSPEEIRSRGDGLNNMSARLSEIGGSCVLKSTPGGGTLIVFKLSLADAIRAREAAAKTTPDSNV